MKPAIVFVGNCQSRQLASLIGALPQFADHEIVLFTTFRVLGGSEDAARRLRDFIAANRDRIAYFIRQKTLGWFEDGVTEKMFDRQTNIIEYPVCLMNYLWPQNPLPMFDDYPRPEARKRYPFTILDEVLLNLKSAGVPRSKVLEAYHEVDFVKKYKVSRLRHMTDVKARHVDALATFPITDFIHQRFQEVQLFRTQNHPSGVLLAEIFRRVTDFMPDVSEDDALRARIRDIGEGGGIQRLDAPIHPQIAEHFGLVWAKGMKFSYFDIIDLSFDEYLLQMYDFETWDGLMNARTLAYRGEISSALDIIKELVERRPDTPRFLDTLADVLLRGGLDGAEAAKRSFDLEPTAQRGLRLFQSLQRNGDPEAQNLLSQLHDRYPDDVSVVIQYAKSLKSPETALNWLLKLRSRRQDQRVEVALADTYRRTGNKRVERAHLERALYLSGGAGAIAERLRRLDAVVD